MTLLITDGTGFLGAYLARRAANEGGRPVVVLDKYLGRGRVADVADQITLVEGDVTDFDTVVSIIGDHRVERVAHFAFILGSPSPGQMLPYVRVQLLGTANVLKRRESLGSSAW